MKSEKEIRDEVLKLTKKFQKRHHFSTSVIGMFFLTFTDWIFTEDVKPLSELFDSLEEKNDGDLPRGK